MDDNNNILHELFLIVIILIDTFLLYHYYDEFGIIIIISTVVIGLIFIKRKEVIKAVNDLLLKIKGIVKKLKSISQTTIPVWKTMLIMLVVLVLVYIVDSRQPIASEVSKFSLMALSIIFHPVINSVALSTTTPNTGDAIMVTADVTDYAGIGSVTANGVALTPSGGLWVGTIVAVQGTHTVDVIATDTMGQTATDSSRSYTAPPGAVNSVGIEFVLIPAGEFDMGSPQKEAGRDDDEGPVHRVKIANAFNMSKYEITQRQWRDIMGNNPSYFKGDNLPVEQVSWIQVQDFISRLNDKEGINKYRLPSEAEWEYAARAGTYTRYYFGDNASKLGDYEWFIENSGSGCIKTHEVGQKKPNPWGLYDMPGNVWEWVQDVYHDSYNGAPTDGRAWEGNGSHRVTRGGSFDYAVVHLRAANRNDRDPGYRHINTGFRLVMDS